MTTIKLNGGHAVKTTLGPQEVAAIYAGAMAQGKPIATVPTIKDAAYIIVPQVVAWEEDGLQVVGA